MLAVQIFRRWEGTGTKEYDGRLVERGEAEMEEEGVGERDP